MSWKHQECWICECQGPGGPIAYVIARDPDGGALFASVAVVDVQATGGDTASVNAGAMYIGGPFSDLYGPDGAISCCEEDFAARNEPSPPVLRLLT